jgi:maltooligosyltrehalose trehalohydrolase
MRLSLTVANRFPIPALPGNPAESMEPLALWITARSWTDQRWQAKSLASAIFYELHVGTFAAGNVHRAIDKLDYLVSLGLRISN